MILRVEVVVAPYKSRPKLLEAAIAFKALSLPILMLPFACSIVSGLEIDTLAFIGVWAITMQGTLLDHHATNYIAKRLLKSGRHPNRILVELTSKLELSKYVYIDTGVLQMEDGRLCFEGVDSSFNIPIDPKTIESFFDTDGNYSSLKLKVAYGAGYTLTIRQKWNWNEGYRLGDLREDMLKQLTEADGETGIAVLPPESNSGTWDPWFTASGYAMVGLGVATFSAAWIRNTRPRNAVGNQGDVGDRKFDTRSRYCLGCSQTL